MALLGFLEPILETSEPRTFQETLEEKIRAKLRMNNKWVLLMLK